MGSAVTAAPPNVLLLMADQMRWDVVTPTFTPNLAALAANGLTMGATYATTPSCTPSRAAVLTGLSPWYHGMLGYGEVAVEYPFEMPRAMAGVGYTTVAIGKNHYFNSAVMPNASSPPPAHGWMTQSLYDGLGTGMDPGQPDGNEYDTYDAWFAATSGGADPLATGKPLMDWNSWRGAPYVYNESWHPTAWVGRSATSFLSNYSARASSQPGSAPFFLKVSFHRPHSPYDPPQRLLDATPESQLPPMHVGGPGSWDGVYADTKGDWCGPQLTDAWCGAMPADNATFSRRAYLASVKFVDEQIGVVLDTLKSTGLDQNTWVLFVSDHGDGQGDHNLWRKCYGYEITSHVPGIIVWPPTVKAPTPRGSVTPLLAEMRDVLPTVLDIAVLRISLPPPPLQGASDAAPFPLNGTSWACLVTKGLASGAEGCGRGGGPWRTTLDLEHSTIYNDTIHWNGIVAGSGAAGPGDGTAGLKYLFHAYFPREQLFNLSADPYEMVDLVQDPSYQAPLARMRERLVAQFLAEGRGPSWVSPEGKLLQRLTGTTYSPNYPSLPQPPIPGPPCNATGWWYHTTGGYYRSCGGEGGVVGSFTSLSATEAQEWCCISDVCAGFDWAPIQAHPDLGSGYYKGNMMCGWVESSTYQGFAKPGQVPGH